MEDVFDIQEKVSRAIVDALKVTLDPAEERRLTERPIDNIHAYECYHRAWNDLWSGTMEGLDRAFERVRETLELIGEHEMLYAAMGWAHFNAVNMLVEPDEAHLLQVEQCIDRIRELNSESLYVDALTGNLEYKRGHVQDAVHYYKRALEVNPSDSGSVFCLAGLSTFSGKTDSARGYAKRLLEIDPLTSINQWRWAWVEAVDGRFDVALPAMSESSRVHPQDIGAALWYALALSLSGHPDQACIVIDRAAGAAPGNLLVRTFLLLKHALKGDEDIALDLMDSELEQAVKWDEHYSWIAARSFALLDRHQKALEWLEHAALDRGFINYPLLYELDPCLENLRGDPGFEGLMREVKTRWERFRV